MFWSLSEHLFDGTPLDHSIYMQLAYQCKCGTVLERKKDSPKVYPNMQMLYPNLQDSNQKLEKFKIKKR